MILFTRENCEDCEELKGMFELDRILNLDIKTLPEDGTEPKSLEEVDLYADADFFDIVEFPSLVILDDEGSVDYVVSEFEEIMIRLEEEVG